jgi:hypothetical protein
MPSIPLKIILPIAAALAIQSPGAARAQQDPGWYFAGSGGIPSIAFADATGEQFTLECGPPNQSISRVILIATLSESLQEIWQADDRGIHLKLESTVKIDPSHRLLTQFFPDRESRVEVIANPVPHFTANDPAAALTFRAGAHDGEILRQISASGLQGPLTELVRTCSAHPSAPGAPSFSCMGNMLQRHGERDICVSASAAELDGLVLARFLASTEALSPDEKATAWARYSRWTEDRLACGRDMDCTAATATAYLSELPQEAAPAEAEPPPSSALEALRTGEGLAAEAALHGIPQPTLRTIKGRTAYVTPACEYSCEANIYAIHDIGPDEAVPLDPRADLATIAEIGRLYGSSVTLNHLRLGHPLPPRFAEGGLPAIARALAEIDPNGHAQLTHSAVSQSWGEEMGGRQAEEEFRTQRAEAAEREKIARLDAFFAEEAARRDRLVAAGHVYRAPDYWRDFYYPETIRGLFEAGRLETSAPALRQLVGGFIVAYNRNCRATMPEDAVPFTETEVTRVVNGLGIDIRRSSQTSTFLVQKELAPYFGRMARSGPTSAESTTVVGTIEDLMSGRANLQNMIAPLAGDALDAQRLVNSHDCRGPAIRQFLANLAASANGTSNSLEAGLTMGDASSESDPAPDPERAVSIGDACMRATGYSRDSAARCRCVEENVGPVLEGPLREMAMANFQPTSVALFHGGNRAQTPAGRAYQACVARTAR